MDLNYVKKLVKLLSESNVDEIEIEEDGKKVRLVKRGGAVQALPAPGVPHTSQEVVVPPPPAPQPLHIVAPVAPPPVAPASPPSAPYYEIKSPIVGTFYRAPAPDAAPFVQVGAMVEPGSVLCIVEAMKLMNEIESDVAGKIVKIMVENGQPVEYDQTLFLVEKA
jgi:acetyl-CoA carboxylase biotin carboxyl carrier protein